jgi:hypothetical protein
MSHEQIYRVIVPVVVGRPADVMLEEVSKPQGFAKLLKKDQSTESGQPIGTDGKTD